jgi:hypothetical protein
MAMSSRARTWFARVAVAAALSPVGVALAYASAHDAQQPARAATTVGPGAPPAEVQRDRPRRPHPGSAFVVGDSLTVGVEPWLRAAVRHRGWRLTGVDARVGRPVAEGLQVLRARRSHLPRTVVIALGTNDFGAGRASVRAWLARARALLGHRRIIWVNLCLDAQAVPRLAAYRSVNNALDAFAPRYDTPAGYRKRASFYAAAVAGTLGGRRPPG